MNSPTPYRFASILATALLAVCTGNAHASIVPIDTIPEPSDAVVVERTFTSFEWHDLAVGFLAPSAGYITHITTTLTALVGSVGPFYVGLASNALIGTPATTYFAPPPGSIWEANVCSNVSFQGLSAPCSRGGFLPNAPTEALAAGEALDLALNVFLPSAGVYWFYTRFSTDDVFAEWTENASEPSTLIARRTGYCAGASVGSCDTPADRTFFLASAGPTPGIRVSFDPLQVPEPSALWLTAIAALAIAAARRLRT